MRNCPAVGSSCPTAGQSNQGTAQATPGEARCAPGLRIVDRPISFSPKRVEMTRAYIQSHYGLTPADIRIVVPRVIVLHWTAIDDLERSFRAFDRETLAGRPDLASVGGAGGVDNSVLQGPI